LINDVVMLRVDELIRPGQDLQLGPLFFHNEQG